MTGYNSPMHRKSLALHKYSNEERTLRKKARRKMLVAKKKAKEPTHPTLREDIFSQIKKKADENRPEIQVKGGKGNPLSRFVKRISGRFKKGDK